MDYRYHHSTATISLNTKSISVNHINEEISFRLIVSVPQIQPTDLQREKYISVSCYYTILIDLTPVGILLGVKSIGKNKKIIQIWFDFIQFVSCVDTPLAVLSLRL